FTQSPSFLDWQIRMEQAQGKNNAASLFGVHQIPSDGQIRNLLDPVPPAILFPLMASIGDILFEQGHLHAFRSIGGTYLVALDGTDFFSSKTVSCPCCTNVKLKDGVVQHRHIALTPVMVAPGQESVIALPPEFVTPQDGHDKQDCELAAAGRWLAQHGAHYAARGMTILGDDLYCHQPFCQQVLAARAHFLLTCKPTSHTTLYEWVEELQCMGKMGSLIVSRRVGTKQFTDTYRFASELPLRNSNDALMVNWCEIVTTNANDEVTYQNAWATSHPITADNVAKVVQAGRSRWKIENENNNTLKTKGYHFEHNFGHGQEHLSNLFATMILLAFLLHTALDLLDLRYRAVRSALPSRRTFFEHIRALLLYLPFDSWDHLMTFMLAKLTPDPATG
ncbi:ISNCY family transposase, partial [Flavobacterium cupreum]